MSQCPSGDLPADRIISLIPFRHIKISRFYLTIGDVDTTSELTSSGLAISGVSPVGCSPFLLNQFVQY
jgi:hypothetical protein